MAITLDEFRRELETRGGEADVWLVHLADRFAEGEGGGAALVLVQAFLTRGAAYSFAEGLRRRRPWQHYYVFHLVADSAWAAGDSPRVAEYETAFGRSRDLPGVAVTPARVARVLVR
jgi:hypothetical protein